MYSTDSTTMASEQGEQMESPGTCENGISLNHFMHYSLIPAALIVGVLSFLQRRHQKLAIDHRLPFLRGRFAVVVPLDTMGFSDRLAFGFAYGAVSYKILLLIIEERLPISVPNWAKALAYLIGALEVGLAYFPFFACLSTPAKIPGAVMGIIYSICWIVVIIWDIFTCEEHEVAGWFIQVWGEHQKLIYEWPWVLSHIVLLVQFIYMLIKGVRVHLQLEEEDPQELMQHHQMQHVKRLLRKIPEHSQSTTWFQRRLYEWDPYFKFPSRVIGTAVVSLFTLYTFALAYYRIAIYWLEKGEAMALPNGRTDPRDPSVQLFSVLRHSWLISSLLASLNFIVYTFHVLVCYRKHLKRLWRGQKGFLPEKFHKPNSAVSVASIARYSGCQIAFTLWGFLIVQVVLSVLCLIFAYFLVIPIMDGKFGMCWETFGPLILTFLVVYGLVKLQEVLVKIFFLQDKMSPSDKQKPLALNNRKAFHCFSYFLFFYNVINGITYCFMRLFSSLVVGTFLLSRLDRTIMLRGYENMDRGYKTWIGMIFADHYHNNPAMVCFCQLLISNIRERQTGSTYSVLDNTPSDSPVDSRARQRWALFYTLLRNPHLIPLRKQHLSASSHLPLSPSPQSDIVVRAWIMASQAKSQLSPQIFTAADC
ncbi:stimulated by retinoic acid gene 6 protein-like [Sphaeramia orbicularis]|uniref:stimulated by retinoic acid gene 6 protein-like n=1 Tax=Sphaeramia orbicularis TaxID=375764 RepID=UPI00117C137B|nr:stimulated by retinoic acid gene 6 protein-like [Sphaeramia orbicularis]